MGGFEVKDSGERREFDSGMVRDTTEGKTNWLLIRPGPMLRRWAEHLSKAAAKYDNTRKPGEPRNWQLAEGMAEYERFQESAARHFEEWLAGNRDEDHAAGVFFNINGAEYVLAKLADTQLDKFHESLKKLSPVTSDDDPDAEAARPRTAKCGVSDFTAGGTKCHYAEGHAGLHSWQLGPPA